MKTLKASLPYWTCQTIGWGLYWAFTVTQLILKGVSIRDTLLGVTFAAIWGVGLTHALRAIILSRAWLSKPTLEWVFRFLIAIPIVTLTHVFMMGTWEYLFDSAHRGSFVRDFLLASVRWSLVHALWIFIYAMVVTYRRQIEAEKHQRQLEEALRASQLSTLQAQLNPHFLFNALNSVRALIEDNPRSAQDAVTQLSRLMRYTLQSNHTPMVSLAEELSVVNDYLSLESLRLGERLKVSITIDPNLRHTQIPIISILTLVENAVKHGISKLPLGGVLTLSLQLENGILFIQLSNPRVEALTSPSPSTRIGLINLQRRLALLFGPRGKLRIDEHLSHTFGVTMEFPV